jgi:hypothetical protein
MGRWKHLKKAGTGRPNGLLDAFKDGWNGSTIRTGDRPKRSKTAGMGRPLVGNVQKCLVEWIVGGAGCRKCSKKRSKKAGTGRNDGSSETFKEGWNGSTERVVGTGC